MTIITKISTFLLILIFFSNIAFTEGLNSENLRPSLDNKSAILNESSFTIPHKSFLLAYTFSYALNPVEFGDGKKERLGISDHLQINHFGLSYGITSWLDFGFSIPIALYSAPIDRENVLSVIGANNRKFFFLGDVSARIKANIVSLANLALGFSISGFIPTGSDFAMLTDDSTKLLFSLPMQILDDNFAFNLDPGVMIWSQPNRVSISDNGITQILLAQSQALTLNTGFSLWLVGNSRKNTIGTTQLEISLKSLFNNFVPSLSKVGSPIEWGLGLSQFWSQSLSWHASIGAGIGRGVPAPLARLVGGLRYLMLPAPPPPPPKVEEVENFVTSEAYTDFELEQLVNKAQPEPAPAPAVGKEDMLLKLKVQESVIDVGAVNFEFNSAKLTPVARETIKKLYDILQMQKPTPRSVKIDGHTDSIGSYNYNLPLSKKRANSVRDELVSLGFDSTIITTEGFAFKYPIASNGTKEGRAQNRRIEVSLDGAQFRKTVLTKEEVEIQKQMIYPNGVQPKNDK